MAMEEEGRWRGRVAMGGTAQPRPDLHEVEGAEPSPRIWARKGLWARNERMATAAMVVAVMEAICRTTRLCAF
ncbi:hypothetical protein NL676_021521 [Syzygium grande]|nr:hypothetical protein NL676_021521 [Syzygium grande]